MSETPKTNPDIQPIYAYLKKLLGVIQVDPEKLIFPLPNSTYTAKQLRYIDPRLRTLITSFNEITINIINDLINFLDQKGDDLTPETIKLLSQGISSVTFNFYRYDNIGDVSEGRSHELQGNPDLLKKSYDIALNHLNLPAILEDLKNPNVTPEQMRHLFEVASSFYDSDSLDPIVQKANLALMKEQFIAVGINDSATFKKCLDIFFQFYAGVSKFVYSQTINTVVDLYTNLLNIYSLGVQFLVTYADYEEMNASVNPVDEI